jgi:inhibitor of KinA sporulation pathway (predicted exonuclease)
MREVVIFDTEYTAWPGSAQRNWTAPGEFREIIQIGALRVDAESLTEVASFNVLSKPTLNPQLSDYIVALTGMTQKAVETDGLSLRHAVAGFLSFCGDRPLWCYGSDGWIVAKNLALIGAADLWPHGLRSRNIGEWFGAQGVDVQRLNSGSLAAAMGVDFTARAHDALNDCRSILAAARALVDRGAGNPFL